jgi:hypothetical protein
LKENLVKEQLTPLNFASTGYPPSFPEGGSLSLPVPPEKKRSDLFKASMLDLGGRSVIGYQSKEKEGNIFGYSVLVTVKLRNGLVPDPSVSHT